MTEKDNTKIKNVLSAIVIRRKSIKSSYLPQYQSQYADRSKSICRQVKVNMQTSQSQYLEVNAKGFYLPYFSIARKTFMHTSDS